MRNWKAVVLWLPVIFFLGALYLIDVYKKAHLKCPQTQESAKEAK